jgi:hypothetical protein
MPKKVAIRLWHRARDFDRRTHEKGKHGGRLGHTALQVLHSLIFDFLNYASGRLDPSYAAIARKANVCERAVATALQKLRAAGILNWVQRCAESWKDGRYAILPDSQWRGYTPPLEAPPPHAETWGATPPLPSLLAQATAEGAAGGTTRQLVGILDSDPADELAAALASFGRTLQGCNP